MQPDPQQKPTIRVKNIESTPNTSGLKYFDPSQRLYVRAVSGAYQRLRRYGGWLLMLLFFTLPWWPYQGQQAVLLDLGQQQFHFFATTLFPQDLTLLAWLLIIAAFALFFITTFLGRVWCGFLCPQTVWTFIFIWFEERFEGSANQRRALDKAPRSLNKTLRKMAKHLSWLGFSLLTALAFVSYFVPAQQLYAQFFLGESGGWTVFWVLFFAACTYANAGWMRAIMCTHMCPYARFQSAMFDRDTYIVAYDSARGEPRGPRRRKVDPATLGLGACIDCDLCVQVCPTGIDIRQGLQYECINCGACVDACDQTMQQMGYAPGLISYTTEHKLAGHKTRLLRPKLIGYGLVLVVMIGLFSVNLLRLQPANLEVLRDRNQLYRINTDGAIENTFILKLQ
ncbi:MAG: cytochrome c oxidase accessory protein CcoG, partial [Plesiomonas sp.]